MCKTFERRMCKFNEDSGIVDLPMSVLAADAEKGREVKERKDEFLEEREGKEGNNNNNSKSFIRRE